MPATAETWTTRKLLGWMVDAFESKGVTEPRRSAEVLLEHVLKMERIRLYAHADRPASPEELSTLRSLVKRALALEPVQYLVGEWWFYGMPLHVDRRVLIPRPCTETLVQYVLDTLKRDGRTNEPLRIADIATGSGCIACALLKSLPNATAIATDIDQDALDVAQANAERHNLAHRMQCTLGNLAEPLTHQNGPTHPPLFDVIVSNPPYIPDTEWNAPGMVGEDVRAWEPEHALRGGHDGLDLIRPLITHAAPLINERGIVAIETAASHIAQAHSLLRAARQWSSTHIIKDLEGHERVIAAEL